MGSSIFFPTQNLWGSLAHNATADASLASGQTLSTSFSDVPWASSAALGQWSLLSKQLIGQTPATQRGSSLGMLRHHGLSSVFPLSDKEQKGLWAGQETMRENACSTDGTSLCVTRMHEAEVGVLCSVKAGELRPMGRVAFWSISSAIGPIYQVLGVLVTPRVECVWLFGCRLLGACTYITKKMDCSE